MPVEDFFARWGPAFARQASSTQDNARRQAEADTLIAKAAYELHDMHRELMAAFDVPLRLRAIKVAAVLDVEAESLADVAPAADAEAA